MAKVSNASRSTLFGCSFLKSEPTRLHAKELKPKTKIVPLLFTDICDPTFWKMNHTDIVTLRYLHHSYSKEHKFSLKWWHKNYQNQFTGLVIVTVWSFNHHSISFWGTCNVFIIQTLATSGCMFKTPFNDIYKKYYCAYGEKKQCCYFSFTKALCTLYRWQGAWTLIGVWVGVGEDNFWCKKKEGNLILLKTHNLFLFSLF